MKGNKVNTTPHGDDRAVADTEATTNGHSADALLASLPADDGKTDVNGLRPGDEGYQPFNTRRANARHAEDARYGSPCAATVVGGLYAAEHAVTAGKLTRGKGGYDAVAALRGILVTDARALGLIDRTPSEADVARWYAEHGHTWEPTAATVTRAGLRVATKGLDPNRKVALTTIDAFAADGVAWAVRAAAKAAADNLDTSVRDKTYSFTLTELFHHHDATVDDVIGLPPMTPETRLESLRLLKTWWKAEDARASQEARAHVAAATVIELPPVTSLDDLLATPDDPVRMRIDQVWPSGGAKGSCAAAAGAGKTTLNGNLLRSLVDGDPFLGAFEVRETVSRIMVIDLEMTPAMITRWLRRQGVRNTAAVVDVVNLRSKAHLFDMGNDRLRDMWVRRIRDNGIEWVTFDCLKPALDIMGLNENTEMGKFLTPFDVMLGEAGVSDALVYHHTGHANGPAGERARGDSTLLGWTDVNLKLIRPDGGDERYFIADKVRDADEPAPEGLLTFDKATGQLTYAGGNRAATAHTENVEKRLTAVLDVLADTATGGKDEMNVTEIKAAVGGKKETTDAALALAEKRGLATRRSVGRAKLYRLNPKARDPLYAGDDSDLTADHGLAEVIDMRPPRTSGPTGQ